MYGTPTMHYQQIILVLTVVILRYVRRLLITSSSLVVTIHGFCYAQLWNGGYGMIDGGMEVMVDRFWFMVKGGYMHA